MNAAIMPAHTASPCRHCRPFPYYICYRIEGDTVYFIGLVHEARHPDFIRDRK